MSSSPDSNSLPSESPFRAEVFEEVMDALGRITPRELLNFRGDSDSVDPDRLDGLKRAGVTSYEREVVQRAILEAVSAYYNVQQGLHGKPTVHVLAGGEAFIDSILAPAHEEFVAALDRVTKEVTKRKWQSSKGDSRLKQGVHLRLFHIRRRDGNQLIKEGAVDFGLLRSPERCLVDWNAYKLRRERKGAGLTKLLKGFLKQHESSGGTELEDRQEMIRDYILKCMQPGKECSDLVGIFDRLCKEKIDADEAQQEVDSILRAAKARLDATDLDVVKILLSSSLYKDAAGDLQAHEVELGALAHLARGENAHYDVDALCARLHLLKGGSKQRLTLATPLGHYRYVIVAQKKLIGGAKTIEAVWKQGVRLASRWDHYGHWSPGVEWKKSGVVVKYPLREMIAQFGGGVDVHVQCETFGQALIFAEHGHCAAVVPDVALTAKHADLIILRDLLPDDPQQVSLYAQLSQLYADSDKFVVYKLLAESMAGVLEERRKKLDKMQIHFPLPEKEDENL